MLSLSDAYTERYAVMLLDVHRQAPTAVDELAAFWPMCGHGFVPGQGLLLVGRATNGWDVACRRPSLADLNDCRAKASAARKQSEELMGAGVCPMTWVTAQPRKPTDYSARRSAFWQVTRQIVRDLYKLDGPTWSSHIAWSDLYKVAPQGSGNPDRLLQEAQRLACGDLLRAEVTAWQPAHILALTGADWFAPFAAALGAVPVPGEHGRVEGVWRVGSALCVVAPHPQGKRNRAELVAHILRAFAQRD